MQCISDQTPTSGEKDILSTENTDNLSRGTPGVVIEQVEVNFGYETAWKVAGREYPVTWAFDLSGYVQGTFGGLNICDAAYAVQDAAQKWNDDTGIEIFRYVGGPIMVGSARRFQYNSPS